MDNSSLLLYRVGPVLCCAPTLPINSIIPPPTLTHPPGSDAAQPGIFRHAGHIAASIDLRYKFGVEQEHWAQSSKVIVTEIEPGLVGFWVDEIMDVMGFPASGWGPLPAHLPKGIFTRTLILKNIIYLYAEFSQLYKIPNSGYLRVYIEQLLEQQEQKKQNRTQSVQSASKVTSDNSMFNATKTAKPVATIKNNSVKKSSTAYEDTTFSGSHRPPQPDAQHGLSNTSILQKNTTGRHRIVTTGGDNNTSETSGTTHHNIISSRENATADKQATSSVSIKSSGHSYQLPEQTALDGQQATQAKTVIEDIPETSSATKNMVDRNNTVASRQQETASIIPGLILIFLFIGIFAGLFWIFTHTSTDLDKKNEDQQLSVTSSANNSLKTQNHADPLPEVIEPVQTEALAVEATNPEPATVEDTPGMDTETTDEKIILTTTSDTTVSKKIESEKVEPAIDETIPATADEPDNTTTTTESSNFKAEIKKDAQGITIVLDAPDEENVFKHAQQPAKTDTDPDSGITPQKTIDREASHDQTDTVNSEQPPDDYQKTGDMLAGTKPDPRIITTEITHIVVKGDTLWHIAIKYVHDPYKYPELARLSNIKNPDLIYPGDSVRIIKRKKSYRAATQ
ncbi:MAG: chemotaxis protein CheW [Thioalkalispiraceae bacterium]